MIFDLPFDVVFSHGYEEPLQVDGWEKKQIRNYVYYNTRAAGLRFQIILRGNNYYLKVNNDGKSPVTGFVGIRYPWKKRVEDYTMIPAIYYDGNYFLDQKKFPILHLTENPVFQASFSASSFPSVLVKEGNKGYYYEISHKSYAGWNGIELDAEKNSLTIYAPAKEKNLYGHSDYHESRQPYTWQPGDVVSVRFSRHEFCCERISDIFDYHWGKVIRSDLYPAYNKPKMPEALGAAKVCDFLYKKHCVMTYKNEPLLLNAFIDPDKDWPHGRYAEWNTMIGWCSGTMTALPLLKFGGKYRDFAIKYIDFLSSHGDSPCGVKYSIYDGEEWMSPEHKEYNEEYDHCRFYGDYLYYLGKAIRYEKANGYIHSEWERDFEKGINILVDLWQREKDFGMYWLLEGERLELKTRGHGSGVFDVLALAEGIRHFPENEAVVTAFKESCEVYYKRCVVTGRCDSGPKDIRQADDSESIAALTDALVQNYQIFGDEKTLEMALDAAKIFATWVVNYVPEFPGGSFFEGYNICGGVIANVRNRHVGPGICTNSARFIYDLGKITGDSRWIDLYFRIKSAAINCITDYDGEFFGLTFEKIFAEGMLSEQINITDALSHPGETWRVSASWPATAVLLGWYDSPDN